MKDAKKTEAMLVRRTAELDALRETALELAAELDLDTLLRSIASRAIALLGGTCGGLYLYRSERDRLERVVSIGTMTAPVGWTLRRGEGLSGRIWQTGEPLVVERYQQWEGRAVEYEPSPAMQVVGVPVRWGDEFLGVLNVSFPAGANGPSSSHDAAELLKQFANHAAIAIRNARLYEQAQREIADRMEAEQALHREHTLLSRIMETSPVGITVVDREGQITFANAAAETILGLVRSEIAERTYNDPRWRITDSDGKAFPEDDLPLRRVMETGKPVNQVRHAIHRPDGRCVQLSINAAPLLGSNGQVEGMVASIEDVSERERVEEAVRESEERYRALVEQMPDGVCIHDNGRIVFSNESHWRMLGFGSEEEILGRDGFDFIAPESRETVRERVRKRMQGESVPDRYEIRSCRRDGSTFDSEVVARTMHLGGRPLIQVILHDITGRKQLERQVLRTQKMESIGTLSSGVAHNFNNILGIILGNAELARMQIDDRHAAREFMDRIAAASERAAALAGQLLTLARKESGERVRINVSSLLSGVSQALRVMLDSNILVHWHTTDEAVSIDVNQAEIEQALMNVCLNARDAMPAGGRIDMEADVVDLSDGFCMAHQGIAPGRHVCVAIRDTGVGMAAETLASIFDPFFTTKGVGRGTGLGLSTAYGSVVNHGGCIDVESEPGKGSTFRLYLPAAEEGEVVEAPDMSGEMLEGSETVLVVDDEEHIAELVQRGLSALGYTILTAPDGREACRVFQREGDRIDLVLLDYMMPEMDGERTFAELKKLDPQTRVLVASGYDERSRIKPLLDAGVDGFIRKPYHLPELSRALRDILDRA